MKQFNKGDKVKCIRSYDKHEPQEGRIYTIHDYTKYGLPILKEFIGLNISGYGPRDYYDDDHFELVKEDDMSPENIVKKLNEHIGWHTEVYKKYPNGLPGLQWRSENGTNINTSSHTHDDGIYSLYKKELSIKNIGGHTVYINGSNLHIGCRVFNLEQAIYVLKSMCNGSSDIIYNDISAFGSRIGIKEQGDTLSWEDADILLKALQEYVK